MKLIFGREYYFLTIQLLKRFLLFAGLFILFFPGKGIAQKQNKNLVFVDKQGVVRWTKDKSEAAFFGVNYTVPFAYGYRSHKALNADLEKAIDADVYHMWRLGLDAFRVHVWDVEITDSLGNLLENEHLRLFDYLIKRLKERGIKILITPIAFWGNGYPERDVKTNGFSSVYGKGNSVVLEAPIKAQENYIQQLFTHVNVYTGLSYTNDPDVIAMEINNEPHHSGPKEKTTEYVNRLTAALKSTGWTKPVFYNISESPYYADAVVKAAVDGHSFQWYPSGLVAGRELKGNFLPHVDRYSIPFNDTIPAFRNRAKMVYEFDAGDIMQSIMYPAMVRSYRTAGFQWATQFAYDPMATAYGNTEYQTHYLNLAYTPAKAISLLIASKAFHRLPRLRSYGAYPADSLFDVFRVSYKERLSEMNSEEEFYYSNATTTISKNSAKLKHVAGVDNSPVVQYSGTGAYFLDRIDEGYWRLEVMPDAIQLRDPFEKASPKKQVVAIQWKKQMMKILLPDLGPSFVVSGINEGNSYSASSSAGSFYVKPGTYVLKSSSNTSQAAAPNKVKAPVVNAGFYAPQPSVVEALVIHQPLAEVSANKPFTISIKMIGIDSAEKISAELRHSSGKRATVSFQQDSTYDLKAEVPANMVVPGIVSYRIIVQKKNDEFYTFPGGYRGNPYAWDEYRNETWQTIVASAETPLTLFDAGRDRNKIMLYNTDWRNNSVEYITADKTGQLVVKATMNKPKPGQIMGWQCFFGDKIRSRFSELTSFSRLVVRARSAQEVKAKISLITTEAQAFAASISIGKEFREFEIPLSSLQKDSFLLLPRPYPGFLPLLFQSASTKPFDSTEIEKLEITFGPNIQVSGTDSPHSIEVEAVWLKK